MMEKTFFSRFSHQFRRELRGLMRDRWLLATVTIAPVLLFVLMAQIFQGGLARDLPVAVVDLDNSKMSRALIRTYDASPVVRMVGYPSVREAAHAVRGGELYGMVVLPEDLHSAVLHKSSPAVSVFYNGQYVLIGRLIDSALAKAHHTFAAKLDAAGELAHGNLSRTQALSAASPVAVQVNPLFNNSSNYARFLLPAIIPAIWQILMIVSGVMAVGRELREQGLQAWLAGGVWSALLGKLMVYQIIFSLTGGLFLSWFYYLNGWPMNGSWMAMLSAQWLMVLGCLSIATYFTVKIADVARSFGMAAAYTAPCFAFVGITFPVTDMPLLARFWHGMQPVSHYLRLQVQQANYGVGMQQSVGSLLALALFGIFLLLAAAQCRKISNLPDERNQPMSPAKEGC